MFVLAVISVPIHIAFLLSEGFSDFFNRYIAAGVRFVFAKLTGWFILSFAETLIVCSPLILVFLIWLGIKTSKKDKVAKFRLIAALLSIITFFYSGFIFTFASSYRGSSLASKLELERVKVSAQELYDTFKIVTTELNALSEKVEYGEDDFSNINNSYKELNEKLNKAYKKASEKYGFLQDMSSSVKPIMLSEPMTYTHISGAYTYFTGEANLNINYPDFNHPYTMAHEMAHQRGVGPENEANFLAYLVCLESDEDYIRYSAYFNMYQYLGDALYSADKDMYYDVLKNTSEPVIRELIAYSEFFDKYRDNIAADVSDKVNNSYLQSQGQVEGTRSYGLVVDLAVAYYKTKSQ